MLVSSIITIIYLAVLICIPVLVGVYVYRDAKSRGMNAALWTLVAILAPTLIGFIVYLLVRGNYSDMKCPKCGTTVTEQYVSCPNCGERLKASCPSCSAPVEPEWKVCPRCAAELPEQYENVATPLKKQDKSLGKILIAIIAIPVILIVVAVVSISSLSFSTSTGMSSATCFLSIEEYLQQANNSQIEEWLDGCDRESNTAYVLRHQSTDNGETEVQYLIYLPYLADSSTPSVEMSSGLFSNTLKLEVTGGSGDTGTNLVLLTCTNETIPKFKLSYNSGNVDCEITDVDYQLVLTDQTDG